MVFLNSLFGKKTQEPPPPPPPRSFDMDNIFDVIEYCILKEPENATDIITAFIEQNPDQINKRYTQETKPKNGVSLWRCEGATPLMIMMRFNDDINAKAYDYTEDGQRIDALTAIFEPELFDNLIKRGADLSAEDESKRTALFYTSIANKNITVKLLQNGLEYQKYFNEKERSPIQSYDLAVHYAIQEFESGKFVRHDAQTAALSHIFYAKSFEIYPSGEYSFHDIGRSNYILSKRLLFDFEQSAVHKQEGHKGCTGTRVASWRTKDIESFETYMNQDLIERARAFMDSGKDIETAKTATSNIVKRSHAPTPKSPIT
jgi:hypothetical protein